MKLVIMTQPTFFVEEDKILTALFDEGMDNLHLYKPGASPMYSERLLSLLPESMYGKITVHENYYLKTNMDFPVYTWILRIRSRLRITRVNIAELVMMLTSWHI